VLILVGEWMIYLLFMIAELGLRHNVQLALNAERMIG
jgi:hypothetical protein